MPEDEERETAPEESKEPTGLDLAYSPVATPLSAVAELSIPTLPDVPPALASANRANAIVSDILAHDSDLDAEGESDLEEEEEEEEKEKEKEKEDEQEEEEEEEEESDCDDDDDEYVPPSLPPLSQRRTYKRAYTSRTSSSTRSSRTSSRNTPAKSSSASRSSVSFGTPATPDLATLSDDADDATAFSRIVRTAPRREQVSPKTPATRCVDKSNKKHWQCPHCPYAQKNRRDPDLRRHISTHFRDLNNTKYICCGVPLEQAKAFGVEENAQVMYFWGKPMVGGCAKELSRKDALKRHLRNSSDCVGDLSGAWHPFNRK